jgi:large subunit ribosomal protein LP0
MGPEKTSFFQALGVATKIARGTIEIISNVELIKAGTKVLVFIKNRLVLLKQLF